MICLGLVEDLVFPWFFWVAVEDDQVSVGGVALVQVLSGLFQAFIYGGLSSFMGHFAFDHDLLGAFWMMPDYQEIRSSSSQGIFSVHPSP